MGVLAREPILAVDTESNSLYAYRERVCLIQFSTPKVDYLVDPLAIADLSSLGPIFADAHIEKVFHAAEYDVICLERDFGFKFDNLFDTMLASRILGKREVGLGAVLREGFGVYLNKRYQRANWGQRPLPAHLLDYARLDTHFLIPLRLRLRAELKSNHLWPLAEEDFRRLCVVNERLNGNCEGREGCWRVSGAQELEPQQAAVLRELCQYRDQVAKAIDRPLFKVMGDKTLLAIATACPRDEDALGRLPGMSPSQMRRHGRAVLQAVQRGLRAEPIYPPKYPQPDERFLWRLEVLRNWRKSTARGMGVDSDIVLPRDLMHAVARKNPRRAGDLQKVLNEVPWRYEQFGARILDVLRGK